MPSILKAVALTTLASVAMGAPAPQRFDNGDCQLQPAGSGPIPVNNTVKGFLEYEIFSQAALSQVVPDGYVQAYRDLHSTFNDPSLFGQYTELTNYDVQGCSDLCDQTPFCNAFTIFFERDPLQSPGVACPNPEATTRIKCGLWHGTITKDTVMNRGQFQEDFHVVIAGSNAYVRDINFDVIPNVAGYQTEVYTNGGAIQAPLDCYGNDTYMGVERWFDGKFDAQRCADICTKTEGCHFVNTYFLRDEGVPFAQDCSLYSVHWPLWYATNVGQMQGPSEIVINATNSFGLATSPLVGACEPLNKMPGHNRSS